MPRLLWLREVDPQHSPMVGAKAANLGRLVRAGLPVPDGFVVSADAYRETVARLPLPDRSGLAAFRAAIESLPVPTALAAEVRAAFAALGTTAVAVRSSSTAEDLPGHSFAGLYDSFLETVDAGGCLALVRRCWASLWTDRAFDYRERNGFVHSDTAMGKLLCQTGRKDAVPGLSAMVRSKSPFSVSLPTSAAKPLLAPAPPYSIARPTSSTSPSP
jgi:pyruvate,water dikinase